jgi:hypothetical protein
MNFALSRYRSPLSERSLPQAIQQPDTFPTDEVAAAVPLGAFRALQASLAREDETDRASWDRKLARLLHAPLSQHVPRGVLLDPGFWHWMTVSFCPEFVVARWQLRDRMDSSEAGDLFPRAVAERFLGAASLRGMSRNALARLFWAAEAVWSEEDKYALLDDLLGDQDLFQGIIERKLGLFPPAVRACVRLGKGLPSAQRRPMLVRLNHHLTTSVLEVLEEGDVERLALE